MNPRGRTRPLALLALGVALVLLVPAAQAAVTRTLVITTGSAQPTQAFSGFDGNPPKAFDVDGDGRLEILAQNDNHYLYVFDSATGKILAQLKTNIPAGWSARTFNGPEAYKDASGVTHLVLANSAAYVTSYRFDAAASSAAGFSFVKEWERRTTDCTADNPGMDAKPTLGDLDRDGSPEIVVVVEEVGIIALKANGALYWKKCIGGGNGEAVVGDLNLDGWPEVVHGSDGGVVTALNGRPDPNCTPAPCPSTRWSFWAPSRFQIGPGSIPVGVAIGQLDGVGGLDVVAGARDAHDATNFTNNHALLFALNSNGALLWGKQHPEGTPLTYTRPIIADADKDGQSEVYWADWNTIGHKPPDPKSPDAWKVVGPACADRPTGGCANFYRYDRQGNLVWRTMTGSFWSNKDIALVDLDGDGQQEVLANGPGNGHDGIWSLDIATGAKEQFIDLYPWMTSRMAVAYDLAGDGGMDLVVETGPMATSQGAAVHVYDTGVPYSAAWPHIPESFVAGGGTSTSTSTGPFDASFSGVRGNRWWIQANVQNEVGAGISGVDARVNGGAWRPLQKQSWGPDAWAASFEIVDGSTVQLRATGGSQAELSDCYRWIPPSNTDAAVVPCGGTTTSASTTPPTTTSSPPTTTSSPPTTTSSPPTTTTSPPPTTTAWPTTSTLPTTILPTTSPAPTTSPVPTTSASPTTSSGTTTGAFAASFSSVRGNQWWIEANVRGNGLAIASVDARVDGGAWRPLAKQSWGPDAWAASFQIVDGSKVQLRATASNGQVDLSDLCYRWIPAAEQNAATVDCGGSTPPPFDASFTSVQGNQWWVQANVRSNGVPLATVEASVDGGAWRALTKQSWGPDAYAASFQVNNGQVLRLRATASDGTVDLSGCYQWIPAQNQDATVVACPT